MSLIINSNDDLSIEIGSLTKNEIELLKNDLFNIFISYENAYSSFNYEELKNICTEEHFNFVFTELEKQKKYNKKRILENFTLNNFKILNTSNSNNIQKISTAMDISLIDYTIDETFNFLAKGNKTIKVQRLFNISFTKELSETNPRKHCPKCGAPLSLFLSNCSSCNTLIANNQFRIDSFYV